MGRDVPGPAGAGAGAARKKEFLNLLGELQEEAGKHTPSGVIYHSEHGVKRMCGPCIIHPCSQTPDKCAEDLLGFCNNLKALLGPADEIWCVMAHHEQILAARVTRNLSVWRIKICRSLSVVLTDAAERLGPNAEGRKIFIPIRDFIRATGRLNG